MKVILRFLLLVLFCLVVFSACEIGLGERVNTKVPVIGSGPEGSQPGAFLHGDKNLIQLDVRQDFGIKSVYMTVWFTDKNENKKEKTIPAKLNGKGFWEVNIDSTGMADGSIRAQVTAVDRSGNTTTTTDMIYIVKNTPPQIELLLPKIKGEGFDSPDMNKILSGSPFYQGNDIMGIASDSFGIEKGYPQILIWPADYKNVDIDGIVLATDPKWGKWRAVHDDNYFPLNSDSLNAVQFRWPLLEFIKDGASWRLPEGEEIFNPEIAKDLPVGAYRIKFRVMDKLRVVNTYPNRQSNVNQYIELSLVAAKNPSIKWYEFSQYYNGVGDFTAAVNISTPNDRIDIVRVMASNDENVDFIYDDNSFVKRSDIGHNWEITINPQIMREMLGIPNGQKMSGDKILHIEAVDNLGNKTATTRQFIIDDIEPVIEFIEPVELTNLGTSSFTAPQVTSTVTIRGAAIDNQRVVQMFYALGRTETNAELGEAWDDHTGWTDSGLHEAPKANHKGLNVKWSGSLSNWSWRFEDIADVCKGANANYYVEQFNTDQNLWLLPVKFKVVDVAGNVNIYSVELIVDPDADCPTVTVSSHNERQIVGGMVRVSGFAVDNEWINNVEIRITAQSDKNCNTVNPPDVPKTGGKFAPVNIVGNKSAAVNWYYNINENGDLDPPKGGTRVVLLEIRAWDASMYSQNVPKNFVEIRLSLVFDLSVPVIEDITVVYGDVSGNAGVSFYEETLLPGTIVKEFVTLRAMIRDDSGITSIKLRSQGEASYTEYIDKRNVNNGKPWVEPKTFNNNTNLFTEYILYISLNTNAPASDPSSLRNGSYYNSAGTYNVDIQVIDNTNPMPFITLGNLSLQIDNYYPMSSYNSDLIAVGDYPIFGRAWDTGAAGINVQGLNRVVVYFSRNGKLISLLNGEDASSAWIVTEQKAKTGRSGTETSVSVEGTLKTLPFFPNVKQNGTFATNDYGIVIDSSQSGPYSPRFSGPSASKDWQIIFPSSNIKDGPLTAHYVIFDNAENATHNSRDIYFANNRPVLTGISLGTDFDGFNGVQPDEFTDYPSSVELNADFRVRNGQFNLNLNSSGGNGNKHYRVSNVKCNQSAVSITKIVKGEIYTIADAGNGINWINFGVFDSPSLGTSFTAINGYSELAALGLVSGSGGMIFTYENTGDRSKTEKEAKNLAHNAKIIFSADSFNGNGCIEDSAKDTINGIKIPKNDSSFLIKVYDSTVRGSTASEKDQLASVVLVNVAVDNHDVTAPVVLIDPFYWNSDSDNSLYKNSRNNGHIELEAHLPLKLLTGIKNIDDLDPKVSGRISFRGTASDNNVIDSIQFKIGNFSGSAMIPAVKFNGTNWTSFSVTEEDFKKNGWIFSAEGIPNQAGHKVKWQLDFDSSFINGAAMADNILTVIADDKSGNISNLGNFLQTTLNARTAHYRFDAVPYIKEVETQLSGVFITNPSAFNRSALGGYPVRENETILIKGFNFNNSSIIIKAGDKELYIVDNNNTQITALISESSSQVNKNSVISGELIAEVNGIPSINNFNNNDAPYNKEPNGLNNNILNDNRRLYVWNTGHLLNQKVIQSPFMRMAPDSTRYMSYGLYDGDGHFYVRKNNDPSAHTAANQIEQWQNRYLNTTVAFDENGDWYAAASNMTGLNYPHFNFYARAAAGGNNGGPGINKRLLMRMAYGQNQFDINRAKIPRIFAQNTDADKKGTDAKATRIFMSYYDSGSNENPVLFHYGTVGNNNSFHGNLQKDNDAFTVHSQAQVVANNSTAYKGSVYTSVGALSNGLPVIAWYDRYNQSLMFSHGGSSASAPLNGIPLTTKYDAAASIVITETGSAGIPGTWQGNAVKIADYAGTHVDLAVDGADNIHLAYYDVRNGGLYYAYIPALDANSTIARPDTNTANIQRARVDTYLSAGTKLMLNVRKEGDLPNGNSKYVPYISYFHASFAETKNSIRIAWRKDFAGKDFNGTDLNDRFTGAWEVMTVPVETVPLSDEFICHGVPTASNWLVPNNGSTLHYNKNVNKTMLVGYMTTDWYEGAILKDEVW